MAELPLRQRWCLAIGAPIVEGLGLDGEALGGWAADHVARARGAHELHGGAVELLKGYGIGSRDELMGWARDRVQGKRELGHVVAVFSIATVAELISEEDAWHVILLAGRLAQLAHGSWDDFGATCGPISDGVQARWAGLPWDTELGVSILGEGSKIRILRSSCPTCGAPRTRPSPSAYVYCDHCGELADYDFGKACEQPLERPGPAYEALRAALAPELEAAGDDVAAYREVQRRLFDGWVDACPGVVPVRVRDPAYRTSYVGLFAEAETRAAFDPEARRLVAEMQAAVGGLGFAQIDGKPRVLPEPYRAMEAAMFAHEARRHELAVEHGLYDDHPDHAAPALVRRIGFSMYAQGWLPYLDEADARALLERTGLVREYTIAEPPETRKTTCSTCGGPLDVVVGARRVVCDHCGRQVEVIGR